MKTKTFETTFSQVVDSGLSVRSLETYLKLLKNNEQIVSYKINRKTKTLTVRATLEQELIGSGMANVLVQIYNLDDDSGTEPTDAV